jgi:hypothetical protein
MCLGATPYNWCLSVQPYKLNLDEEKSKHANLARKTILAQHFCTILLRHEAQQSLTSAREECNKYDLTGAPCL